MPIHFLLRSEMMKPRKRPDVPYMTKGKIPALVDMAAGDQPQIDGAEHVHQVGRAGIGT